MSCDNCQKPTTLTCPTCTQLKLPTIYFCSQDCFKAKWKTHKVLHMLAQQGQDNVVDPRFAGYKFTGSVRPVLCLTPRRKVPEHIPKPDYAETGDPKSERIGRSVGLIACHPEKIIEKVRVASKLGREVLNLAINSVRIGMTTDELDEIVHNATIERNAYPSTLNYRFFPKSLCTSVNEVVCHGIPDGRKLQDGDILNIDISLYYDGVHTDLNETICVGNVDPKTKRLVEVTRNALEKAIAICKPGTMYRQIGDTIEGYVKKEGFSVVRAYCGHGTAELFHSSPNIPHYGRNKAIGEMKPGHIFTIEPMINMGHWEEEGWPDGWTSVTKDGKPSAQFEQLLLITKTGVEVLTGPFSGLHLVNHTTPKEAAAAAATTTTTTTTTESETSKQ